MTSKWKLMETDHVEEFSNQIFFYLDDRKKNDHDNDDTSKKYKSDFVLETAIDNEY